MGKILQKFNCLRMRKLREGKQEKFLTYIDIVVGYMDEMSFELSNLNLKKQVCFLWGYKLAFLKYFL